MKNYAQKLRDPRWQKKRLEILSRDNFTCQQCGENSTTQHVHHVSYIADAEPWDYDNENFVTLCEGCHWYVTDEKKKAKLLIDHGFIFGDHIFELNKLLRMTQGFNPGQLAFINDFIKEHFPS